ncbi:phosphate ABC transporter permease PtsA [Caulobacter sp. CCUG 60055]|uniref:phosphate ABC transporter permease PstA n=1 Tax=Caulobacter sp. CCUG 60055 TaxID=2100090 RepID=UPI001FA70CF8|nr:phosphate ABC transporter permease PstA [Caulobacteraceae bacterium]MCI3182112.1 phosphate ABC transporter permease PtsA [Caulobacter sp. CCUG 60055]
MDIKRISRTLANTVFIGFCFLVTFIALAALAAILWSLIGQGFKGIDLNVFTKDTPAPGSTGGLRNAILGSLMLCGFAMLGAAVVGVLAGTWLSEYGKESPYARVVRFMNDVLLSAPSILVGLFVYELMVRPLHGFSGFAGAVALALIAAPVVTRATEDVLNLQPTALREAGIALGAPRWVTIRKVIWRSAGGGLLTGLMLAFARISGETAPLLFTALNNQFFNWNMTKPMSNLPVVIFNYALTPYDDWRRLAWVGALLITVAVLAVNTLVRAISSEGDK